MVEELTSGERPHARYPGTKTRSSSFSLIGHVRGQVVEERKSVLGVDTVLVSAVLRERAQQNNADYRVPQCGHRHLPQFQECPIGTLPVGISTPLTTWAAFPHSGDLIRFRILPSLGAVLGNVAPSSKKKKALEHIRDVAAYIWGNGSFYTEMPRAPVRHFDSKLSKGHSKPIVGW